MPDAQRFPYTINDKDWGEASLMPYLPITLRSGDRSANVSALVDSGATVNVLPYSIGQQLGLDWEEQTIPVALSGNLQRLEAKGIVLMAEVSRFSAVKLVFAWVKSDDMPVLLGQTNFFMEFNVYFYRTQQMFEIQPK
jgi:hypothetical protein